MKTSKVIEQLILYVIIGVILFIAFPGLRIVFYIFLALALIAIILSIRSAAKEQNALKGNDPENPVVYCTKNAKTYHSTTKCSYIARFTPYKLTLKSAKRQKMAPCSGCCSDAKYK